MKWTNDKILETIKLTSVNGVCNSSDVGMTVTTMARRKFGSFSNACKLAGVKSLIDSKPMLTKCSVGGCNNKPRSSRASYCEMHYYRLRRTNSHLGKEGQVSKLEYQSCVYCGSTENECRKYCSGRCATRDSRNNLHYSNCSVCNKLFIPDNKGVDYRECSDNCRTIRHKARAVTQSAKDRVLNNELFDKELDVAHVLYLYNHCMICKERIDKSLTFPDLNSMTIDHIIPLSKGGSHSIGNVQLAHLKCNVRKHNKMK